jgi:hypothetical protein
MTDTQTGEDTSFNNDATGVAFEQEEGFSFNMNETAESSGFEPMPAGTYDVAVEEVKYQISRSSGAPMWAITYVIASGEFAEKNRKLFQYLTMKPEQRGRVKQWVNRVAPELASLTDFNPKKIAEDGILVGKRARAKVGIETSEQYGARNTVKDILAPTAGGAGGDGFQL